MKREDAYKLAVEQIKEAGKSIIENAETIAGGYKYQIGDVDVTVTINPLDKAPTIDIRQSLIPEGWAESCRVKE